MKKSILASSIAAALFGLGATGVAQAAADGLPNGNISLFDNGTQHTPQYSRGVEYRLDEQAKTATMVWDYRHVPDYYVSIQGGLQTLPNGNRVLGWGSAANDGGRTQTTAPGRHTGGQRRRQ